MGVGKRNIAPLHHCNVYIINIYVYILVYICSCCFSLQIFLVFQDAHLSFICIPFKDTQASCVFSFPISSNEMVVSPVSIDPKR